MAKKNVLIIGAAGRDFHNFNTYYRENADCNVVAFRHKFNASHDFSRATCIITDYNEIMEIE